MSVRLVLFIPSVRPNREIPNERCQLPAAGEKLIQQNRSDIHSCRQRLNFVNMTKIIMGNFVREYRFQVHIIGLAQQSRRHDKLSAPSASGIDLRVINHIDLYLPRRYWSVHYQQKGNHEPL